MWLIELKTSSNEFNLVLVRFVQYAKDPDTKVVILTGADPYYCAGVNLSATIQPMHPK